MEQLQYIKQTLSISAYPEKHYRSMLALGAYQIISISTVSSVICTILMGTTFPIYLLNGFLLPLLFFSYRFSLTDVIKLGAALD